MHRILLIILTMIYLISSSSNDEEADISLNTHQNDNLILLADVALMGEAETNKSQGFNIHRMELQVSHGIEASSLPNKCIFVEKIPDKSQNFIKDLNKYLNYSLPLGRIEKV